MYGQADYDWCQIGRVEIIEDQPVTPPEWLHSLPKKHFSQITGCATYWELVCSGKTIYVFLRSFNVGFTGALTFTDETFT